MTGQQRRRGLMIGAAMLALGTGSLAIAAPEVLLPPGFGSPAPAPAPTATPRAAPTPTSRSTPKSGPAASPGPAAPVPSGTPTPGAAPVAGANPGAAPVIQPLPGASDSPPSAAQRIELPEGFPTLEELEALDEDQANELLGLRPKFDIPPAARRSMQRVGVINRREGGFAFNSLSGQPAGLVRSALQASKGPIVSRWGHILMRRALASRMDAPADMNPVEFATLRARALTAMGEATVARALVQDVDGNNYDRALTDAAFATYLMTGDVLGMCPVARLQPTLREDGEWELMQSICGAYQGDGRSAERRLDRALGTGLADEIDVRLAQRYAGVAINGRRAVNIEWDDVSDLSPWRFGLARALGEPIPDKFSLAARYTIADALIPAVPLNQRAEAAMLAGQRGVLSSSAMVGAFSQLYASESFTATDRNAARQLREAYVAASPAARLVALQSLWNADSGQDYGGKVLTAYAAARFPVGDVTPQDAASLIAAMLSAGLDRNAMRWAGNVAGGSEGWALLALANPAAGLVDPGDVNSFIDDSSSAKAGFLIAGLAGLGRMSAGDIESYSSDLELDFNRSSAWSSKITRAGQLGNPALVALLAGLGMQGTSWGDMTPRHLFHIVRAMNAAGLSAEARMIAAEAVARG